MLDRVRPDEVILAEAALDEGAVLEVVDQAHRQGIKVRLAPETTELLVQRGEYVPGQGAPLFELRPPVLTGWDWALKRAFDLVVGALVLVVGLPIWLLIALAVKLDSRGPIFFGRPAHRRWRARVRDAQVSDDGGRRRLAAAAARGGERGRGGALQDPGRSAVTRVGRFCAGSRSTKSRSSSTSSRAR